MDRASILGDAIDYLNGLGQSIRELHNEENLRRWGSSLTLTHPLPSSLPFRVKDEPCLSPTSLPTPNEYPPKVKTN